MKFWWDSIIEKVSTYVSIRNIEPFIYISSEVAYKLSYNLNIASAKMVMNMLNSTCVKLLLS